MKNLFKVFIISFALFFNANFVFAGMFDSVISNDKIFEAITPAFQTIIGGFIGLITGIKIGQDSNESE